MKNARFWAVILLLVGSAVLLARRGRNDRVPSSRPLTDVPRTLDNLTSTDIPIDQATLDVLGKGYFLNRVYMAPPDPNAAAVPSTDPSVEPDKPRSQNVLSLFIAYFPTQRSGQSIHSPQNCLPGAGWTFDSSGTTMVPNAGHRPMQVGEYLISNGAARSEVLYWYQSHGRSIANDYKAKFFMLTDSIRLNRTDAALVRIVAPMMPGEDRDHARARAVGFAQHLAPMLPSYIPD